MVQLHEIIKKHKGQVTKTLEEADHVIFPPCTDLELPNDKFVRVIKKKGKDSVLIHRLYSPDSHDEWINNIEIDDDAAGLNDSSNNASGGNIWEVSSNWLLDTEVYNEWMNQEDYEVDSEASVADGIVRLKKPIKSLKTLDDITKKSAIKRSPSPTPPLSKKIKSNPTNTRKRKHEEISSSSNSNLKENNKENGDNSTDLTKNMDAPVAQPHVEPVQIPKNLNIKKENPDYHPYRNGTVIDLDEENNHVNSNDENKDSLINGNGHYGHNGTGQIPLTNNTNTMNNASSSVTSFNGVSSSSSNTNHQEQEACEQTHHIIVPSYSAWFDYKCIHEIEKRALPEFFNQKNRSKSPEIYMGYRNFMIDTYRLNPGEYLSATACRRNLPGDVCAIMRVHAFLEQWGLINYQVDYEARAAPLGPPCTSHFTILADTPSGLAPITGIRPTTGPAASKQMIDLPGSKNKNSHLQLSKTPSTDDKESLTLTATSTTTTTTNLEKLNVESFGLNTKVEKKQSIIGTNGLLAGNSAMRNQDWSDQELLLLLEGLEMHKDDWNKVCEHVGTRTQDECILKFLQLPIEDPYLDPNSSHYSSASLGPLAFQPIPFSNSGNPIMSTVAFLASIVDPRVASAAAKAAIAEFTKMKDEVPTQIMESHLNSVSQAHKEGKQIDANYNIQQTGIAIVAEPKSDAPKDDKKDDEGEEAKKTSDSDSTEIKKNDSENKPSEASDKSIDKMEVDSSANVSNSETDKVKPENSESEKEKSSEISNSVPEIKMESNDKNVNSSTSTSVTLTTTTTTTTTLSATVSTTNASASTGSSTGTKESTLISEIELKNAAASALAAAAVKARQLALNEEKN